MHFSSVRQIAKYMHVVSELVKWSVKVPFVNITSHLHWLMIVTHPAWGISASSFQTIRSAVLFFLPNKRTCIHNSRHESKSPSILKAPNFSGICDGKMWPLFNPHHATSANGCCACLFRNFQICYLNFITYFKQILCLEYCITAKEFLMQICRHVNR